MMKDHTLQSSAVYDSPVLKPEGYGTHLVGLLKHLFLLNLS